MQDPSSATSPAAAPAAAEARRLDFIDVLRGLACLWVVLHHATGYWIGSEVIKGDLVLTPLTVLARIGYLGVHVFLVLSGFCLYYPIVRKQAVEKATVQIGPFFERRAWRILPPYYAALLICMGLVWIPSVQPFLDKPEGNLWLHLLMLHNLFASEIFKINAPFWSLALESQLYAAFPLMVWVGRKGGIRGVLLTGFAISVLWQFAAYRHLGGNGADIDLARTWLWSLPARCFEFMCGMAAAVFVARPQASHRRWALALSALLLPYALWSGYRSERAYLPLRDQVWGVISACAIVALSHLLASRRYVLQRHLWAALVWLGTISYSVYLVHIPVIKTVRVFLKAAHLTPLEAYGFMALVGVPLMVAVGYGFFLLFERPFLNRNRKKAERRAAAEPKLAREQ